MGAHVHPPDPQRRPHGRCAVGPGRRVADVSRKGVGVAEARGDGEYWAEEGCEGVGAAYAVYADDVCAVGEEVGYGDF